MNKSIQNGKQAYQLLCIHIIDKLMQENKIVCKAFLKE